MSASSPIQSIKKSQRESQLLKEVTELLRKTALDDPRLAHIFVSRVTLSADSKICTIYFYTLEGETRFEETLEILKLYKPSLRKALASRINRRYTPELLFKFDTRFGKQQKLEELFEKIKTEESS